MSELFAEILKQWEMVQQIPDADLPLVKAAYAKNGATKSSVARQFGVGHDTIRRIVSDQRKTA